MAPIRFATHSTSGRELIHVLEADPNGWVIIHPKAAPPEERALALAFMHDHIEDADVWDQIEPACWAMGVELYTPEDYTGTLYELSVATDAADEPTVPIFRACGGWDGPR